MIRGSAWVSMCSALLVLAGAQVSLALHASQDPLLEPSKEKPYAFSLRGSVGLLDGQADELVYEPEMDDYKLSELNWDLSGLAMGGAVLSAAAGKLGCNAGFWVALTQGDGEMKDYDWFIPGMDWTDYSRSEVDVESAYSLDINANYLIYGRPEIGIRGVLGFKHDYWEWSDSGQEFIYSTFGFRDTIGSFEGQNVIDYQQTFDIPYVGLNLDGRAGPLGWNAYALYSPLVSAEDKDHHILRDLHFEEDFDGGDFFALGVSGSYRIGKQFFLSGAVDYQDIPEITGDMLIVEDGESYEDSAGIANNNLMVSLAFGWLL
ncbi:MAG TPA: omptin family outer membrane protease [Kiritimatiellia bacterium]|nr:omptin family outer membrane protease [Kiritimatiellia bacterium]HRZ10969.1 omptin family outer membrane protease [Kiritimatiellia bacterium]HSA18542.1 omptin family outer membrane protease [Kiritimatiellia bacterium]